MTSKNTLFAQKQTINCKGSLLQLDTPKVMGIINITPDSFYTQSRTQELDAIVAKAAEMLEAGADFLDVGGYSSRPGAALVSEEEELQRVLPVVKLLSATFPAAVISVDTFRASIARKAVEAGAAIVNDISAGELDNKMIETVAALHVPYIIMHMQGTPQTMQQKPVYTDVVKEVIHYLGQKVELMHQKGIADIIIDPGFGFGKIREHNFLLLSRLAEFKLLCVPILVGLSRKSMLYTAIGATADTALAATISANTIALLNGAAILRVHDVKEAADAVKIVSQLN